MTTGADEGYLASAVTIETGRGGPECPWRIHLLPGRRVDITLINFNLRAQNQSIGTKSNACYQLAVIREDSFVRTLTECEGAAPRESHAYTSITNDVYVGILATKSTLIFFLLHYKGRKKSV